MTDNTFTTPVRTAFELQRSTIEQGQRAIEHGVEFQQQVNAAALDALGTTEEAQRQGVELTKAAIHSQLDAVEASVPGSAGAIDQVRETVDEQFAQLETQHGEAFETAEAELETGVAAYDDLVTDSLEALTEQLETLLEAHDEIQSQTLEAFQQTEQQFEELQSQLEAQGEQFQSRFEAQAERFQAQFEEQFEQFQAQLEEMQERVEAAQAEPVEA